VTDKDEKWALFWCSLLRPVLFGEIEAKDANRYLKDLAQQEYVFPDGRRKRPSHSTLKRKLKLYREGGFEALARKPRKDRGQPRVVSPDVIATAIEAKREQPRRSDETLNRILQERHGVTLSRSTLYRHLKQAGATRIRLGLSRQPVRKRWSRDHTHDLWLGDFEEGPYVAVGREIEPTHLSAFIDCHSRTIVEGRYYLSQKLDILIDSWIRALATHGAPLALYVDNAKVYHARGLQMACYRLGVRLLHRPPHDPAPGGLIERFFGTAQSQFEAEIRAGDLLSLDELNRALSAWLEVSYHQRVNSETGQTPRQRYEQGLAVIRQVDLDEVLASFLQRVRRNVHRDFSDVRLHNRFYRVDPRLRGETVQVRFDPFSAMDTVQVYSLREEYLGQGVCHTRDTGIPAPPHATPGKPKYNYPQLLIREHDQQLAAATRGIDYRKVVPRRPWPFHSFVKTFARLLGRKGGVAAFAAGELETLKKVYNRSAAVNEALLKEAFERAPHKSIPYVAHELHKVLREQEKP
jgi:transposase InsO family protein